MGCIACRDAKNLLLSEKVPGTHLSEEWINGEINSAAQNKLRKKIYKHRDSIAHKRAIEVALTKQKAILPNKVIEVNYKLMEETATSFRSAYMVAKERLSYRKLTPLMKLQELNGAKVGTAHKSDHSCAEIVGHIAQQMRKKFVSNIRELNSKISITIDESTVHGRAYLIVYVRCDVSGKGDIENVFFRHFRA